MAPRNSRNAGTRGPYRRFGEGRTPKHIGDVIRLHRRREDMTQEALAKTTGIQRSHLAQIETGRKRVTVRAWESLLKALPDLRRTKTRHTHWTPRGYTVDLCQVE